MDTLIKYRHYILLACFLILPIALPRLGDHLFGSIGYYHGFTLTAIIIMIVVNIKQKGD